MRTGSPMNADVKGQHEAEYAWFAISDSLPGLSMSAERAARPDHRRLPPRRSGADDHGSGACWRSCQRRWLRRRSRA